MIDVSHRLGERDTSRFVESEYYVDLDSLCKKDRIESGLHSFDHAGLTYDFYVKNNAAKITLFSFCASTPRKGKVLPIFTGNSVFSGLPVNTVLVADPGLILSKNLPLAWYASCFNGVRTQEVISQSISSIARQLGSETSIMFGASGGGFAALYYSWKVKGSLALPVNPQTDICNYNYKYVEKYAQCFLTARNDDDVMRALKEDIESSVLPLYSSGFRNNVLYVQNSTDWHVEKHMHPFLRACDVNVPRIIGDWGHGHVAPPKGLIRELVEKLVEPPFLGWDKAIKCVVDSV